MAEDFSSSYDKRAPIARKIQNSLEKLSFDKEKNIFWPAENIGWDMVNTFHFDPI